MLSQHGEEPPPAPLLRGTVRPATSAAPSAESGSAARPAPPLAARPATVDGAAAAAAAAAAAVAVRGGGVPEVNGVFAQSLRKLGDGVASFARTGQSAEGKALRLSIQRHDTKGRKMWLVVGSAEGGGRSVYYVNEESGAADAPPARGWILGQDGVDPPPQFELTGTVRPVRPKTTGPPSKGEGGAAAAAAGGGGEASGERRALFVTGSGIEELNVRFARCKELKDGVSVFEAKSADGAARYVLRRTSRPKPMWIFIETKAKRVYYVNTERGAEDEPPLVGWRVRGAREARLEGGALADTCFAFARARRILGQNGVDPPPKLVRG